jgi:hypothetical protein
MVPTKKLKADENKIIVPKSTRKPRARELHDVLATRPVGAHKNPRDRNRLREKQETRAVINEALSD